MIPTTRWPTAIGRGSKHTWLAATWDAKYDRAEALFQQVLDATSLRPGLDASQILTTKVNLAALYFDQKEYDRAEPLLKEAIPGLTAQLGADHPSTLASKNNLAALYFCPAPIRLERASLRGSGGRHA